MCINLCIYKKLRPSTRRARISTKKRNLHHVLKLNLFKYILLFQSMALLFLFISLPQTCIFSPRKREFFPFQFSFSYISFFSETLFQLHGTTSSYIHTYILLSIYGDVLSTCTAR